MSNSTSSKPSVQQQNAPKTLTDFSIESLIGDRNNQTCAQLHPKDLLKSSTTKHQPQGRRLKVAVRETEVSQHQAATVCQPTTCTAPTTRKHRPKNFQCPACKMAFSNNGQLKNHVRIHTGERPFRCSHHNCNKTFTRNEELTRHKLIHTGVRPHACTTCGKRFGRKDHLKKHARTHDMKRLRKKMFVSNPAYSVHEDNMFSLPKTRVSKVSNKLGQQQDQKLNHVIKVDPVVKPSVQNIEMIRTSTNVPVTSGMGCQLTSNMIYPLSPQSQMAAAAMTGTAAVAATSTTSAIQQLASDYWYGLLGFYQNQNFQLNR